MSKEDIHASIDQIRGHLNSVVHALDALPAAPALVTPKDILDLVQRWAEEQAAPGAGDDYGDIIQRTAQEIRDRVVAVLHDMDWMGELQAHMDASHNEDAYTTSDLNYAIAATLRRVIFTIDEQYHTRMFNPIRPLHDNYTNRQRTAVAQEIKDTLLPKLQEEARVVKDIDKDHALRHAAATLAEMLDRDFGTA